MMSATFMKQYSWFCFLPRVMFFFVCLIFFPVTTQAGIYVMVDANGVYHFTNAPTSRKYHIFIKEKSDRRSAAMPGTYHENPARYESLIKQYSEAYGVDIALVKAIIHAESHFNPYATSNKGAQGLMQLMPETARDFSVQDVFNPADNIRGGVKYLKTLLKKFNGNVKLSLAAYNAGPHVVNRYGKIPPYRETKRYIKKVMTYYQMYR